MNPTLRLSTINLRILVFAFTFTLCAFYIFPTAPIGAQENEWFDRQTKWHDFEQFHFKIANRNAYLVTPKKVADGKPWIWRARFPGYHNEMDIELVAKGFHVAYVDVGGMFGSPTAIKIGDKFYDFITLKRGLSKTPALEGVSRGGLFVYNWAAKNPDKVSSIYCDTPVLDFKSWPAGKGSGVGSAPTWKQCLKAYGFSEIEAIGYDQNPIDNAKVVAKAKIPILHIVSENDRIVPPTENTYILKKRLEELGHELEIISVKEGTKKSNGHHFTHPDPQRVVKFFLKHKAARAGKEGN